MSAKPSTDPAAGAPAAPARNLDLATALVNAQERFAQANPESGRLYEHACASLPGGNTRTILYYPPFPLTIARGAGAKVWDADGHEYVDLVGEYTAGLYGHSHPVIRRAVQEALDGGTTLCAPNHWEGELAAEICARFPSCDRVRFTNSGTEANLMAITAARAHTGRSHVMVFDGAYHGGVFVFNAGAARVNAPYPYVVAPYNDTDATLALIEAHAHELAVVMVEPMMGSAGAIAGGHAFLQALREATRRHGIILLFDEVMTSRLSSGGLQKKLGITPDLTSFGKYIGGGFTFGAFGGGAPIMDLYDPRRPDALPHAGTFNNNVVTMSAGLAGLRELWTEAAADALNARGDRFRDELNAAIVARGFPARAIGIGSIIAVHMTGAEIDSPADLVDVDPQAKALLHMEMLNAGIYVGRMGLMSLSLPLSEQDYATALGAFERFMDAYSPLFASA